MNKAILEEIDLLLLFGQQSSQQGIKVHSNASEAHIEAANRLFEKGFISQVDGGYLTQRGMEAADHAQHLLAMLSAA